MRTVRQRVLDMLQAIAELQSGAPDRATFDASMVVQRFVAYQLLVLGEAAYKMPAEARQRFPDVPWDQIAGMRHVLVHGYYRVQLDIVWGVVERDLPVLRTQLEGVLQEIEAE